MSKLYVISGAAGMTGNELVHQILARGDCVIGFDNFYCSSLETLRECIGNPNFMFYEYDLNNTAHMDQIKEHVEKIRYQYQKLIYINCGAVVHTEHFYKVKETFETNILGMKHFLDQAIEVEADIYINCSTSEIYSMSSYREEGVMESDYTLLANAEHSQRTSYAVGKMMTEFFMRDAVIEGKILGCSIRFANVYSKNELLPKHIIPYIITSLIKDSQVTLLENSRENRRTFLHNRDSCAAVLSLCDSKRALDGSVYNVATDEEISIIDLVKLCAKKLDILYPKILFSGYRESDPTRRVLSTKKIRSVTDWAPVVSLSEGLDECIAHIKMGEGE